MRILSKEFQQIGEDEFLEMRTKTFNSFSTNRRGWNENFALKDFVLKYSPDYLIYKYNTLLFLMESETGSLVELSSGKSPSPSVTPDVRQDRSVLGLCEDQGERECGKPLDQL